MEGADNMIHLYIWLHAILIRNGIENISYLQQNIEATTATLKKTK